MEHGAASSMPARADLPGTVEELNPLIDDWQDTYRPPSWRTIRIDTGGVPYLTTNPGKPASVSKVLNSDILWTAPTSCAM